MAGRVLEANLYSYAANNPVMGKDPSGLAQQGQGTTNWARDTGHSDDLSAFDDPPTPPSTPATSDLPNITVGTPPPRDRHHAAEADLVYVDRYGTEITKAQAERKFGRGDQGAGKMRLTPDAADAFRRLRAYADRDGIDVANRLQMYSGFRPDRRQAALNAAEPGSLASGGRAKAGGSTHRTANAMDVTVSHGSDWDNNQRINANQLHRDPASQWLEANAPKFGFEVLGVVRNSDGTVQHQRFWEPWHITYNRTPGSSLPPPIPTE